MMTPPASPEIHVGGSNRPLAVSTALFGMTLFLIYLIILFPRPFLLSSDRAVSCSHSSIRIPLLFRWWKRFPLQFCLIPQSLHNQYKRKQNHQICTKISMTLIAVPRFLFSISLTYTKQGLNSSCHGNGKCLPKN